MSTRLSTVSSYPDVRGGPNSNFFYNRSAVDPKTGYAPGYRQAFVCVKCRHYSKTQSITQRYENVYGYQMDYKLPIKKDSHIKCPFCHKEMDEIGPKFRPPKKNDIKTWKQLELYYNKDLDYYSFGAKFNYTQAEMEFRTCHPRIKEKEDNY